MKQSMKVMIAGAALGTALWAGAAGASEPFSTSSAGVDEQFSTLANVETETLSRNELAAIEGKQTVDPSELARQATLLEMQAQARRLEEQAIREAIRRLIQAQRSLQR
ncbi:MAG: hypothetical protein ACRERD_32955 [Candidatus Binatia bacterium]